METIEGKKRRKYTVAEREQVIAELGKSGQSAKEFCRERGLGYSTLAAWRRAMVGKEPELIGPLTLVGAPAGIKVVAEVDWGQGVCLRVMSGCEPELAVRLVEVLK
jgi:transposase-like protein